MHLGASLIMLSQREVAGFEHANSSPYFPAIEEFSTFCTLELLLGYTVHPNGEYITGLRNNFMSHGRGRMRHTRNNIGGKCA